MTEQTGFPEPSTTPETFDPPAYVPPEDVGSAAAPPSAPDPSQEPLPAESPAQESDTAPEDAAAEPAPEPPAGPAAEEIPPAYVPEGQPSWLTDLIHWFDDRLRKLGG